MAIEGTGIKAPSSGSQKMAKVYYGGPEAEKRRQLKKDLDKFNNCLLYTSPSPRDS